MSAPTGQICTVLPEKYDANGRPDASSAAGPTGRSASAATAGMPPALVSGEPSGAAPAYTCTPSAPSKPSTPGSNVPICWRAPRICRSMNSSPAISLENRVQRWHRMQRSRSSRISVEIASGLANVRLTSTNRLVPRPLLIAWFCRGHSPPLSQVGQSSGWLISSSSITPCWALSATAEVRWVRTTMPGVASSVHEACGLGIGRRLPSRSGVDTSTRHCRQAPAGLSSGWSQNRGIWMPTCSAARITRVPLGTDTSTSSMVNVTPGATVPGRAVGAGRRGRHAPTVPAPWPTGRDVSKGRCGRVERAPGTVQVRLELLAELLQTPR